MNPHEKLKALAAEAKAIAADAEKAGGVFSDDQRERLAAMQTEADAARAQIKAADAAKSLLDDLGVDTDDVDPADVSHFLGLGDAFVKSEAFTRFRKAHPSGVGEGTPLEIKTGRIASLGQYFGAKATIFTGLDRNQPQRLAPVDLINRPRLTLLDLITKGTMSSSSVEYLQIIAVTRNAGIVAEGELKPTSDLTTALADAKAYTYADGFDITNQALADDGFTATWMQAELPYSLDTVIEDKILNGSGAAGQPRGILATSGVLQQSFATDMVTTVRKGITQVTRRGGTVQAVVMSPEDDEAWDLLKDGNDRYYGQGPFGVGPNTAWGRPRVVSEKVPVGTAILGDFRTVALLDREGLSILAFNQHKDYAQRNMTYVRAELRAGQAIFRPARLTVCDLTAA